MASLVELDSLEVIVINDNEVDPMSKYVNPALGVSGQMKDIALGSSLPEQERSSAKELRMDSICCGSHGLSLMIVCIIRAV